MTLINMFMFIESFVVVFFSRSITYFIFNTTLIMTYFFRLSMNNRKIALCFKLVCFHD